MSKRLVKVRECDRCPRNRKPNLATKQVPFSFDGVKWLIDLCDDCYDKLEREMYAWGRLGEEIDQSETARFTEETRAAGIRLAELRAQQREDLTKARPVAPEEVVPKRAMHLANVPTGLPDEAKDWVFSDHAIQRMRERNVSAVQALFAALSPEIQRPGRDDDTTVCYARGVKAVVKFADQVVLTVAREDSNQFRKAN